MFAVMERKFYAKILLFGEYSLMAGSKALTLPFTRQGGGLMFPGDTAGHKHSKASNQALQSYLSFLTNTRIPVAFSDLLDLDRFARDLEDGLFFHSDIPSGYGMGSSGALAAALYHRYARERTPGTKALNPVQLQELRGIFAAMESFFHGKSSGMDPLTSYTAMPLLVESIKEVRAVTLPSPDRNKGGGFFLKDTGSRRKTAPLVALFRRKYGSDNFKKMFHSAYIPLNDHCITAFLSGESQLLEEHMRQLSGMQLRFFREMIPDHLVPEWEQGLESGAYSMKLCGAGGGGYLLAYSNRELGGDFIKT